MTMCIRLALLLLVAVAAALASEANAKHVGLAEANAKHVGLADETLGQLGKYHVDKSNITVSGISSGACMATQFHIAYSSIVTGMAAFAGAPFYCANDNLGIGLACLSHPQYIVVPELIAATAYAELTLSIDRTSNLRNSKVWLWSGTNDDVVSLGTMKKMQEYYENFIPTDANIKTVYDQPSGHAWITSDWGNACDETEEPYINKCAYPAVQEFLSMFIDDLAPKTTAVSSNIKYFSQQYYTPLGTYPPLLSLDTQGAVYVPSACASGELCGVHVAFHGCLMGMESIGSSFVEHSELNQWAETNNLIVLYPQAIGSLVNPKGCWDWWGYTGTAYATKLGPQMQTVMNMINAL